MPARLRVLIVILGILGLIAGVLALVLREVGDAPLIIILALGLLFLGITRLGVSASEAGLPGWLRALGIVVGILALILWILVLVFPGFGNVLLFAFLAVGLVFHGIDRATVDGMNAEAPGWSRGFAVVTGVLLIVLGILVVVFPVGFGILTAVVVLSIALFVGGLSAIASGIAGVPLSRMGTGSG